MQYRLFAGFLGLALAATLSPVAAQTLPGNLYVSVLGGVQLFSDNKNGNVDIEFDTGFVVGGLVGIRFAGLRAEAELDYQETEANDVVDVEIFRYTAGLYYDIPVLPLPITPYVGGGLGLASIEASNGGNDETNFTWHGEIGGSLDLGPNIAIVPAYRYEWIDNEGLVSDDPVRAHAFRMGVRWSF